MVLLVYILNGNRHTYSPIHNDNWSAIHIIHNGNFCERTKHIDINYH